MNLRLLPIFALLLFFIPQASAVEYPSPVGYVNDFAGMLTPEEEARLNSEITAIEKSTTVEIAIVTVDSLQGVSVEEYAVKLFEKWGIGKKASDNGLLILVAKNEREYRIETGYGLEGSINAATAGRIGRDIIEPNFRDGRYGTGLYEAVREIRGLVENDPDVVARYEGNLVPFDITVNDVPRTYYIDGTAIEYTLLLIFFSLIPFGIFVKKHKKLVWTSLLGVDAVLLIAAYFNSEGLLFFTIFFMFFQVMLAVFIFGFRTGEWGKGGFSGGRGGSWGSGGGRSGGFGGGRSGGGGHSGRW